MQSSDGYGYQQVAKNGRDRYATKARDACAFRALPPRHARRGCTRKIFMKIKQALLLPIVSMVFSMTVSGTVNAQYTGPGANVAPTTVMAILKEPVEDQDVVLTGVLLKKLSKEKYMFSDGSGQIRVEIDSKYMLDLTIDEKTRVEIRGEVEKDFLESPEIDVKMIRVVK